MIWVLLGGILLCFVGCFFIVLHLSKKIGVLEGRVKEHVVYEEKVRAETAAAQKDLVVSHSEILTLKKEIENARWSNTLISKELEATRAAKKAELSARKSSEVRTGHIAEKFAPFLDGFKHQPAKCQFLGQPIDFVVFDNDAIHFVEVKSGNAALTPKQRKIRDLVAAKKVFFEVFRVGPKEG